MNRPDLPVFHATVNGRKVQVAADPGRRLSQVLREDLGLTGTKTGCDAGDCGACTVLMCGEPVCACLTPAAHATGRDITTVEGLSGDRMAPLQRAFLRHGAAQCGICTPGMLMAAAALLERTPSPTRAEAEAALSGVLCRCTGYAKIIAAVCDVGDLAEATAVAATAAVGAPIERLDGPSKVLGTEAFGADHMMDGALFVRAVRTPHARARFSFGDIDAWAATRPAVDLVLTAKDIPGRNCFGAIPAFADQPALAENCVRFPGEAVAIVAGPPRLIEELDLSGFPVYWVPEEPVVTPEAAAHALPMHPGRDSNRLISGHVRCGDPDAALAGAAFIAEGGIDTGYVEHAYIEPEAGIAWMDGGDLVIRACTQAPYMDRDDTAAILGLPPERVRIIPAAAGGGFGAKLDLSLQPLIGLVTLKTGRPARMVFSRAESMISTTKRHPGSMRARIGADAAGRVVGMTFDGDFNTGAYASWGPTVAVRVPVHAGGPYRMPNYRAEAHAIHTNGPISGAFRGFGVPQAAILQETLFDDLALAIGLDRLEFRRQNALADGDKTVCGQRLEGVGIGECLDALRPHWVRALADAQAFNDTDGPVRRGVGIASCWYGCGNTALPNPSTIRLGITADGRVRLHQGATDIGQGANTVIAQIAADGLGLAIDRFELVGPDTGLTPDCGKTSASRQTYVTGKAAALAAQSLRAQILRLTNAGEAATLTMTGDAIVVRDGDIAARLPLGDLPPNGLGYVLMAEETYDPPTTALDADGQGTPYAVYGYGAQIAEVAVDMRLGTVKVLHMTAAHDVGRIINPILAQGQIEGGIAQGIGLALMEEFIPGRTNNLHDYLIPTTGDVPPVTSILIEKPDPEGPLGAKGLGEHVLIPTAPAILNAIHHASGARLRRLPALPHRVRAAILEAGRR